MYKVLLRCSFTGGIELVIFILLQDQDFTVSNLGYYFYLCSLCVCSGVESQTEASVTWCRLTFKGEVSDC